ncbi:alanyl-tRNA editing protein [Roseivivax sp. CAU 1753]
MTRLLFRDDPELRQARTRVTGLTEEGGVICADTVFYPTGGGQPGDSGSLEWVGGLIEIATAIKGPRDTVILVPAAPATLPPEGAEVTQRLDWARRYAHMRIHTALHLLSVVIPLPVTGGQIGAGKGRLDFAMPEPPEDRDAVEDALNALIARDLAVTEEWIDAADLDANPGLVKTLSVRPPRGAGRIRLVRIGDDAETVDLQPCGGTHVRTTGEIGPLRLGEIENKGRQNRRVHIALVA